MPTLAAVSAVVEFRIRGLSAGKTLGEQVRNRRLRLKLTLEQASRRSGIAIPTLRAVEADRARVSSLERVLRVIATNPAPRSPERAHWRGGGRDERFTPPHVIEAVERSFGHIDCDPCHDPRSFVRPRQQALTISECGLKSAWRGRLAFMNPPYSDLGRWLERARLAWENQEVEIVVGLVPVRTHSRAFHQHAASVASVLLLQQRMSFFDSSGELGKAGFPLMLVIWGGADDEVRRLHEAIPSTWMRRV